MSNPENCPMNTFGPNNTHKAELCAGCSFSNRVGLDIVCDCPEGMTIKIMGQLNTEYILKTEDHSKAKFQDYVKENFHQS